MCIKDYAYYNLGTAFLSVGQYLKARDYLLKVEKLEEEPYHNIMLNQKLAILFIEMGDLEEAGIYLEQAVTKLQG